MIEIFLNGNKQSVEEHCTIAQLIEHLNLTNKRLAVEVNLNIVPRSEFVHHQLTSGDRVEIIHAVGGG
jgi:thiamine biosynthesis protein ThiS